MAVVRPDIKNSTNAGTTKLEDAAVIHEGGKVRRCRASETARPGKIIHAGSNAGIVDDTVAMYPPAWLVDALKVIPSTVKAGTLELNIKAFK